MVNCFDIKVAMKSSAIEIYVLDQSQISPMPFKEGQIGCAIWLVDPKWPPGFVNNFNDATFHQHFDVKRIECPHLLCIMFYLKLFSIPPKYFKGQLKDSNCRAEYVCPR